MKQSPRAICALFLTAAIWGFAMAAQREASRFLSPFTFNACRFTLGALALLPLFSREKKKTGGARSSGDFMAGALVGAALFIASFLQQMAVGDAGAGKAGFITALYVVLVPVLNALMGRKPGKTTWLALLLALPALYLLCLGEGESFSLAPSDTILLISAFFWAGHILLTDHFVVRVSPIRLCIIQFAVAAALNWLCALGMETILAENLVAALLPVAYCGIMSTAVGYTLQTVGQKGCKPALAALILCLESVFCVIAGAILLGEKMTVRGYLGCGLMLLAVMLAQAGSMFTSKKEIEHV